MNRSLALQLCTALAVCLGTQQVAAATTCGALPGAPDVEADALACMPLAPPSDAAGSLVVPPPPEGWWIPDWYASLCEEHGTFCGFLWEVGTSSPPEGLIPLVVHDDGDGTDGGQACLVDSPQAAEWLLDKGVTQDTCTQVCGSILLGPAETDLLWNPWNNLDCFCFEYPHARICLERASQIAPYLDGY